MTVAIRPPADEAELQAALDLRTEVFVVEQGVPPELETDEHDAEALHLVGLRDSAVVATCRLRRVGDTVQLGRLVVARDDRRRGIASALLADAERRARAMGVRRIVISAQTHAVTLYEAAGYTTFGAPYTDAGITHVSMERPLA